MWQAILDWFDRQQAESLLAMAGVLVTLATSIVALRHSKKALDLAERQDRERAQLKEVKIQISRDYSRLEFVAINGQDPVTIENAYFVLGIHKIQGRYRPRYTRQTRVSFGLRQAHQDLLNSYIGLRGPLLEPDLRLDANDRIVWSIANIRPAEETCIFIDWTVSASTGTKTTSWLYKGESALPFRSNRRLDNIVLYWALTVRTVLLKSHHQEADDYLAALHQAAASPSA